MFFSAQNRSSVVEGDADACAYAPVKKEECDDADDADDANVVILTVHLFSIPY